MFKNNLFERISDEYLKLCLNIWIKYISFIQLANDKLKVK